MSRDDLTLGRGFQAIVGECTVVRAMVRDVRKVAGLEVVWRSPEFKVD